MSNSRKIFYGYMIVFIGMIICTYSAALYVGFGRAFVNIGGTSFPNLTWLFALLTLVALFLMIRKWRQVRVEEAEE